MHSGDRRPATHPQGVVATGVSRFWCYSLISDQIFGERKNVLVLALKLYREIRNG